MSTAITILGGVGLFLLGITVITDGLKALAGSALRTVMAKAAATPLSGLLGCGRHATCSVIECGDNDDDWARQRRTPDVSSGIGSCLRSQCWRDGNGLARRAYRRACLACSLCIADDFVGALA